MNKEGRIKYKSRKGRGKQINNKIYIYEQRVI
jgi:hypothetical protein